MIAKKERKISDAQRIMKKFICEGPRDKYFYGRETKIANKLIKKYSLQFFEWLEVPFGYKTNSLLYFLAQQGGDYLRGKYFEYLKFQIGLESKPAKATGGEVVGENVEINKKPRTVEEFLSL